MVLFAAIKANSICLKLSQSAHFLETCCSIFVGSAVHNFQPKAQRPEPSKLVH